MAVAAAAASAAAASPQQQQGQLPAPHNTIDGTTPILGFLLQRNQSKAIHIYLLMAIIKSAPAAANFIKLISGRWGSLRTHTSMASRHERGGQKGLKSAIFRFFNGQTLY